ncbi:nuclear transport factor 2 family protein [Seohaeicola zhoushanensis]|nr:nuclear transport factor 2 family protein [Seohaeicola zhoushanensis]
MPRPNVREKTSQMAIPVDEVIAAYGAAWLEADADRRLALLETCWSDAGHYLDPGADVQGRQGLADHIGQFHARMPGARIELTSGASTHHGRAHFCCRMVTPEGAVAAEGVDFGRLAQDGRLDEIVGFFGAPPSR